MKKIIRNGSIAELNAVVFGQKLNESGASSYTRPLTSDEEIELLQRMLSEENPANWETFLREYRKHYPLCNLTINFLIDKAQDERVAKVLVAEFNRYGYTEEQGTRICNKILAADIDTYRRLLNAICTCPRILYPEVVRLLVSIDARAKDEKEKFADVYQSALRKYRADSNLDRFYEQEVPAAK